MPVLIDSNVLLDVFENDEKWAGWSQDRLEVISQTDQAIINPVIYSEIALAFAGIEVLDAALDDVSIELEKVPRPALFLAARVFQDYRRGGGTRTGVLPDFFIGAHAAVMAWPLLTRDAARYRTYFPKLRLITP